MINIENERASIKRKNISTIVRNSIVKEGLKRTRILYAGVNPNNTSTMCVYKVIELLRGVYYYEETVFDPTAKSVHTTLTSIKNEKFHKIITPKEKLHQIEFHPNPQIVSGVSYSRNIKEGKVFFNTILSDYRSQKGLFSPITDIFINWKIRRHLNKRI